MKNFRAANYALNKLHPVYLSMPSKPIDDLITDQLHLLVIILDSVDRVIALRATLLSSSHVICKICFKYFFLFFSPQLLTITINFADSHVDCCMPFWLGYKHNANECTVQACMHKYSSKSLSLTLSQSYQDTVLYEIN